MHPGQVLYFFKNRLSASPVRFGAGRFSILFLALFFAQFLTQVCFSQQSAVFQARATLQDLDGNGSLDATVEGRDIRVVISGQTGNPVVYYVKGVNFQENLFPPIIIDQGYKIDDSLMKCFSGYVGGQEVACFGYNIRIDDQDPSRIVVIATANLSPERFSDSGLALTKRYTFPSTGYAFSIDYVVSNLGQALLPVGGGNIPGLRLEFSPGIFNDSMNPAGIIGLKNGAYEEFGSIEALQEVTGTTLFSGVGLKTQFFVMLLDAKTNVTIEAKRFQIAPPAGTGKTFDGEMIAVQLPAFTLAPLESQTFSFQCYLGPKTYDDLKSFGREALSDYGFLGLSLLRILQFFYGIYPSYGLAIILLTLFIRLLLYPMTMHSTKSMAKVQKIQPLVQAIKDKYKDEPQKFNEEVLKLYQKHNVNPLGGCLPMLLQLPIFFAIYQTINTAVELRKVPFLWLDDLAKPDPILLLPVVIAVLTFYQQGRMSTDPQQKQMAMFMPVFMFAISWTLPSGLLLYWFTSTAVGVVQQIQANKFVSAFKEE